MPFTLPDLPYEYNALKEYIDARTMKIHHTKHHAGYTNNLNNAIAGTDLEKSTIEEILKQADGKNAGLRNNAGGFYNHNLFWKVMSPEGGGEPGGGLKKAIIEAFGSFDGFKEAFAKAAATRFGSGWAWLCVAKGGKVKVCSTANQDNPLMPKAGCTGIPILGLDVWEHAYYLKYQNRRGDYIQAFFNLINWAEVQKRYNKRKK
jgi:Fe-Mn family superoxide dismutase